MGFFFVDFLRKLWLCFAWKVIPNDLHMTDRVSFLHCKIWHFSQENFRKAVISQNFAKRRRENFFVSWFFTYPTFSVNFVFLNLLKTFDICRFIKLTYLYIVSTLYPSYFLDIFALPTTVINTACFVKITEFQM